MRHFLFLLIIAVGGYFAWQYADKQSKRSLKRFTYRHAIAVLGIVVALLFAMVAMFYNHSISIL
jgi:nicotinamide riboside transporter PnuC